MKKLFPKQSFSSYKAILLHWIQGICLHQKLNSFLVLFELFQKDRRSFKCGGVSFSMRKLIKTKVNVVQNISNMASKKETVLFATYKKWVFLSDFEVQCGVGKVISAVCKYCPEVE